MSFVHLRNIDSDIVAGTLWSYQLDRNSGPEQVVEFTIPGNSTRIGYGFSPEVGAGAQPKSASLINFEVVQGSGDIAFNVEVHRVSASGSALQLGGTSGSATLWPGWWAANFTALSLGTWGATDRLRVSYRFVNSSSQSRTVSLLMNGESSRVTIPWVPQHRWGGSGSYRRIRARVGRYGGPLAVATEPNNYSGQTQWNMAPLFYSNNLGLNWHVARSSNSTTNDAHIAQTWKALTVSHQRGGAVLAGGDGVPRFEARGFDPSWDSYFYGARGASPNTFNWFNRITGEDWWVENSSNTPKMYSAFHSGENGVTYYGRHRDSYSQSYGVELASGRHGVSIAFGLAPATEVVVVSGGTSYLTRADGESDYTERARNGPQWNCVAYSPDLEMFVVGAEDGTVWTSTNGTSWTQRTPPPNAATNARTEVHWLPTKTFGAGAAGRDVTEVRPGRFVMFGTGSIILSEDGINWFTPRFAPARNFRALAFSREMDVLWAGGRDGRTAFSIDHGTSWYEWGRVPQQIADPYLGGSQFKVHPQSGIHVTGMEWLPDKSTFYIKAGPKPPVLQVVGTTQTSIELGWNQISGATYDLRRSDVIKFGEYTWTNVLTGSSSLSLNDTGLMGGSLYAYSIRANTVEGEGEWSQPLLAQTVLAEEPPVVVPILYLVRPEPQRILWNYISGTNPPTQQAPAIQALRDYGFEVDTVTDAQFIDLGIAGGSPGGALIEYDGVIIRTDNFSTITQGLTDWNEHPHLNADEATGWVGLPGLANLVRVMSMSRRVSRVMGLASNSFPVFANTIKRVDESPIGRNFPSEIQVLRTDQLSQNLGGSHAGEPRMHRMGLGLESSPEFIVEGTTVRSGGVDPPYTPFISPVYEQVGGVILAFPSSMFGAVSPFPLARAHYGIYQSDIWTSVGKQLFLHTVDYWLRS